MKTLIIIPARMSATRLPGKPLLKLNGISMVSTVFKVASKANIGDVIVAGAEQEIVDDVKQNGGNAILTDKDLKTGTDRIFQALKKYGSKDIDFVMNIQADEPLIEINAIKNLDKEMKKNNAKIGTLAAKIDDEKKFKNPNIVKVITESKLNNNNFPLAKTFKREIDEIKDSIYHHIGIYCYSVESLKRFVNLNQTESEKKYRLEQLRALDNNIKINVKLTNHKPMGVDTYEDYMAIKKILEYKN